MLLQELILVLVTELHDVAVKHTATSTAIMSMVATKNVVSQGTQTNRSTNLMSISLNVVSMAAVFWDCFRRSAMRARMVVIRTCNHDKAGHETESKKVYSIKDVRKIIMKRTRRTPPSLGATVRGIKYMN